MFSHVVLMSLIIVCLFILPTSYHKHSKNGEFRTRASIYNTQLNFFQSQVTTSIYENFLDPMGVIFKSWEPKKLNLKKNLDKNIK